MTFGASVLSLVLRSFLPVPLAFDARQLFRGPLFVLLFVPRLSFPPFHFQSLSFPRCFPLGHPTKITGNKLAFGLVWRTPSLLLFATETSSRTSCLVYYNYYMEGEIEQLSWNFV